MFTNENLRQSATTASIVKLEEDEYVVTVRNANLNGVTCEIEAQFPRYLGAMTFVQSFGLSECVYRELVD